MSKVVGSYESVVRGVSEQNPQSRRSGQHEAQVNMISDPVRGLARRHGSLMQDERIVFRGPPDKFLTQTERTRVSSFFVSEIEYDAIMRTAATPDTEVAQTTLVQCFNKVTRKFIPVVWQEGNDLITSLVSGGVSAVANVGRFLYIAGNTVAPTANETAKWDDTGNKALLAGWVRGGAYSRTFKATVVAADGTRLTGEYKTFSSSYPEALDTSDIILDPSDSDEDRFNNYQKKINDRTNLYNSAATTYIGEAAADITPENIAQKLVDALIVAGVSSGDVRREGGYVVVDSGGYVEIEMEDSGDDSLVRNVGNTIDNIDLVSSRHYVGKVLKVEPEKNTGDPVYLEAFARDDVSTGWTEVVWRESTGYLMEPQSVFAMATVEDGVLYIAGSASGLATLAGISVPDYEPNKVGDGGSAPLPEFFGKRIDYLGVFQDRLVVGTGSTLMFSRSGDYLNWFRQSVLSIEDDDPWEGYALGAEDDIIKYSALYDRSLLLYGQRFQYVVSGRQAFVPATANIAIASAYKDVVDAPPKSAGNFVFYCKYSGTTGKEVTSLHQVQPGVVTDVSDTYPASQVLDTYLKGKPVELLTMQAPNIVFLRTTDNRSKVFTYSYLDNPNSGERLFDSWSHWDWLSPVGSLAGMSEHKSDVLFYMIRSGTTEDGQATVWYAAEKFVRDTDLSDYPYMDSLRPLSDFITPDAVTSLHGGSPTGGLAVAVGRGVPEAFLGVTIDRLEDEFLPTYLGIIESCWVGYCPETYVIPTNPFMRDQNGQAILSGRTTVGKIRVAVTDTAAMVCDVTARGSTRTTLNFTGRVLADPTNLVGRQPVVSTDLSATIGGEVRECSYRLSAVRWLPFTVNAIEWQGQSFNRGRRV